jgi:hypothetical protein
MYRTGMTSKLAEQKQELNAARLKIIEKDGVIERFKVNPGSWFYLPLSCEPTITGCFVHPSEIKTELEQSQMAREQDAVALNQARDAQRES